MWLDANKCNDQGPRGAWLSFIITNNTTSVITNVVATWSGFTGTNASYFVAPHDPVRTFTSIPLDGTVPVFFYIDYSDVCNHPHSGGTVYDGYTANYTLTVNSSAGTVTHNGTIVTNELLSASAAGIAQNSYLNPEQLYVGQIFTQTVLYSFGNNIDLSFQPNAEKSFPDNCLRLIKDSVSATSGSVVGLLGTTNTLYFPSASTNSTNNTVTITYTWKVIGYNADVILHPWAAAKSGQKRKYSGFASNISIACIYPVISYAGSPYCRAGIAIVTLNGQSGGTYSSTSGLVIGSNTGTVDLANSTPGTYTVTYSANNGICNVSTTTGITISPGPSLFTSVSNVNCFDQPTGSAIVTAIGDTPPYTYAWNTSPVITNATATGLIAGTYTVTVTGNTGCIKTAGATITQPASAVSASITEHCDVNNFNCTNGSATVSASGGNSPYTYLWNSSPVQTSATASNLHAGFYAATVTDNNNCKTTATITITDSALPVTNIWTASGETTDWDNSANWSENIIPTPIINVIIPDNPAGGLIFPIVNISNASCYSLTIESGASITVPDGNTISVSKDFTNNGNTNLGQGTFIFNGCSAQTITGNNKFKNLTIINPDGVTLTGKTSIEGILTLTNGTLNPTGGLTLLSNESNTAIISGSGTGTITGNIDIQRYLGNASYASYWYISSPVSCTFQQIVNNLPVTGWGAIYRYNQWSNVWKYDETDISQVPHPDGVWMNGWIAPLNANETMQTMRGYAVYVNNDKNLVINGPVNNGTYTMPVTYTSSVAKGGSTGHDGWNFIGNPYPSPIDWDAPVGWIKENVANAIYFYESVGPYGGSYKTYVNGIGVPSEVNGIIAPMQGFFIKTFATGNISVTNAARVNLTNTHFFKKETNKQIIRLKVYNKFTSNITDETAIYFNNNASDNFDDRMDAYKIFNSDKSQPNLFTIKANKYMLAINSQHLIDNETIIIPLSLKVNQTGEFTINATEINNLPQGTIVYLIDIASNKAQNLNDNPKYSFFVNTNIIEGRFFLKINTKPDKFDVSGKYDVIDNNLFYTYSINKTLNIVYNSTLNLQAKLDIFNLAGQTVISKPYVINGIHKLNLDNGCYILRLIINNHVYSKKITLE